MSTDVNKCRLITDLGSQQQHGKKMRNLNLLSEAFFFTLKISANFSFSYKFKY